MEFLCFPQVSTIFDRTTDVVIWTNNISLVSLLFSVTVVELLTDFSRVIFFFIFCLNKQFGSCLKPKVAIETHESEGMCGRIVKMLLYNEFVRLLGNRVSGSSAIV